MRACANRVPHGMWGIKIKTSKIKANNINPKQLQTTEIVVAENDKMLWAKRSKRFQLCSKYYIKV